MAAILHKFLKKSSSLRTITTLNNPQSLNLSPSPPPLPPFFLSQPYLIDLKPQTPNTPNPFPGSLNADQIKSSQLFFPSFSIEYFLNPISPSGVIELDQEMEVVEVDEVGDDDARKIWADSVKKKRKRKMNKHKYKKLRKKLRRKT